MPNGENDPADASYSLNTTRLEAFSDGVFAIAITLLVLDLSLPRHGPPLERVLHAWPSFLAYVVSFLTIGAAWLGHTALTDRLMRADHIFLRLNLLLLLAVAFLPFPTRLVANELHALRYLAPNVPLCRAVGLPLRRSNRRDHDGVSREL